MKPEIIPVADRDALITLARAALEAFENAIVAGIPVSALYECGTVDTTKPGDTCITHAPTSERTLTLKFHAAPSA
jgi:hypothetical protein